MVVRSQPSGPRSPFDDCPVPGVDGACLARRLRV